MLKKKKHTTQKKYQNAKLLNCYEKKLKQQPTKTYDLNRF